MSTPAEILIIDDDRDLVNSVEIILQTKSYQVRSAFNGKEGYDKIKKRIPDLILLDVMMATDTEGFDLAYKLREEPAFKNLPILMLTSFLDKVREEGPGKFEYILGEQWPAHWLFEKPVDSKKLLAKIEGILGEG